MITAEALYEKLKDIQVGSPLCRFTEESCRDLLPVVARIEALKREKNAILLAHNYVAPQILYSVVHHMPLRPSSLASMPDAIDSVLAIGMAKKPEDRFQNATELVEALAAACDGELDDSLVERARSVVAETPWREY